VVLKKIHKRKLINKSPDKYDDDNEIDDLTESFENTVCVIIEKNDSLFKLGYKSGVLKECFHFNV